MKMIAMLLVLMLSFGCIPVFDEPGETTFTGTASELALQYVVQDAAGKFFDDNPGWAEPTWIIVDDVLNGIELSKLVTAPQIRMAIQAQIPFEGMKPYQIANTMKLLDSIEQAAYEYVQRLPFSAGEAEVYTVRQVLTWISTVAFYYAEGER